MDCEGLILMLEKAALAYNAQEPIFKGEQKIWMDCKNIGVQFYAEKRGEELDIVFRGTDSVQDWKTDFRIIKKLLPDGKNRRIKVHSGFLESYMDECVQDKMKLLMKKNLSKVHIIGHSYGAALSVLCALDLQKHHPNVDYEVVLFGCPRVGNRAFKEEYNKRVFKTFRVENGNDIVTKLPFALMGYRHVGIKLHVGKKRTPFWVSVKAHQLRSYYEQLWKDVYL